MNSILRQLAKYQSPNDEPTPTIHIKQAQHPYEGLVETLCDITDPAARKRTISDALVGLHDFAPPPMADQLYPLETAVLYHLFYRHKISLCSESKADAIFGQFLKTVATRDGGLGAYMQILKNCLDKTAMMIFLYRVMLAGLGARGRWDSPHDHLPKNLGMRAAGVLGVEASARAAGRGLDSLAHSDVEQLILGRVAYVAFWKWSRTTPAAESGGYLMLPVKS